MHLRRDRKRSDRARVVGSCRLLEAAAAIWHRDDRINQLRGERRRREEDRRRKRDPRSRAPRLASCARSHARGRDYRTRRAARRPLVVAFLGERTGKPREACALVWVWSSSAAPAPPMAVPLSPPVHTVSEAPAELAGWRIYQSGWLRHDRFRLADQHGDGQQRDTQTKPHLIAPRF